MGGLTPLIQDSCRDRLQSVAFCGAGGIQTRTRVTSQRILRHQQYANPSTTVCSVSLKKMRTSTGSAPITDRRSCQVRSTFAVELIVD